jgi:hypothetical protein
VTLTTASVPVSSPLPGTLSGSLIVTVTEMVSVEVFWTPWTVFVPSTVVAMVPGMLLVPSTNTPAL